MDYNNISHLHNFQLSQDTYNAFYNLTNAMISIYLIIDHLFITNSYLIYNLYLFSIDSLHSNICTSLYIPKSLYTLSTNSPLFRHLTVLHSSSICHHSLILQSDYPSYTIAPTRHAKTEVRLQ